MRHERRAVRSGRALHLLCWMLATAATGVLVGNRRPARGDAVSDQAAPILIYPYVVVDGATGRDTVLQLSNATAHAISVQCAYQNVNSHCTDPVGKVCATMGDCAAGASCAPGCSTADVFRYDLSAFQSTGWLASPAVPEVPFRGSLRCVAVDGQGVPTGESALRGEATLERYRAAPLFLDVSKYTAVGIVPGAVAGCPGASLLPQWFMPHFFGGASDAVSQTDVSTRFILVPCSQEATAELGGGVSIQYRVYDEYAQPYGTIGGVNCLQDKAICNIDATNCSRSMFSVSATGTLTGETALRFVTGGLVGVIVEEHGIPGDPSGVQSAAFNMFFAQANTPTASVTATRTHTATPPATAIQTLIPTTTPTASPTATSAPTQIATVASTGTPTGTLTRSPTASRTPTPSVPPTSNATATSTGTATPTAIATSTQTATPGRAATATPTVTPTSTHTTTSTLPPTPTMTPAPTGTGTAAPTARATFTRTPSTTATASVTATAASTATGTPPATLTPTVRAVVCGGDCNTDGTVTVNEILTMANIALGNAALGECSAGDANRDGVISVDEILTAVQSALRGC